MKDMLRRELPYYAFAIFLFLHGVVGVLFGAPIVSVEANGMGMWVCAVPLIVLVQGDIVDYWTYRRYISANSRKK